LIEPVKREADKEGQRGRYPERHDDDPRIAVKSLF
jgi:hypothetical protein